MQAATHAHHGRAMAKSLPDSLGGAGLGPLESHYFKVRRRRDPDRTLDPRLVGLGVAAMPGSWPVSCGNRCPNAASGGGMSLCHVVHVTQQPMGPRGVFEQAFNDGSRGTQAARSSGSQFWHQSLRVRTSDGREPGPDRGLQHDDGMDGIPARV